MRTWTLVRTSRHYRRPSTIRLLASCVRRPRDRTMDQGPADWSDEERERWMNGPRSQRARRRLLWHVFLAMRLVYAVNERRSWNAATRRVAHRRA